MCSSGLGGGGEWGKQKQRRYSIGGPNEVANRGNKALERGKSEGKDPCGRGKSPNATRLYDQNGFRRRAAALCIRTCIESGEPEIMLVTAGSRRYWILPGGGLEAHESLEEAAIRELKEEAGVEGTITATIDEPWLDMERLHHTKVFVLSPVAELDDWEDCKNGRERKWMNIGAALENIKPCQSVIIERNIEMIHKILGSSHSDEPVIRPFTHQHTDASPIGD